MNLSSIDRKLVDLLQAEFPLTRHPYSDVGLSLDLSEAETIAHIKQLKAEGIIRQISPVLDARRLGYQPTLVAMRMETAELDTAEQFIIKHPEISHAYERNHYYNLWFTLATPAGADTESELERLTDSIGAVTAFALPAVKVFKIGAYFAFDRNGQSKAFDNHHAGIRQQKAHPSPADRKVINELQQDLPLVSQPFTSMSSRLGMGTDNFLSRCQSLIQRGIIRRFGAAVNHRKAGFKANAMTCWAVPPGKAEFAGQKLAYLREVSHCYERKTNPLWRYNLFAMIHGRTREACREIADKVSADTGLTECVMLFSTRELKKTRVKYLV